MNEKVNMFIMIFIFMSIHIKFKLANASETTCDVGYGMSYKVITSGSCSSNSVSSINTEQGCKDATSAASNSFDGSGSYSWIKHFK